jgi:hypothetical protein
VNDAVPHASANGPYTTYLNDLRPLCLMLPPETERHAPLWMFADELCSTRAQAIHAEGIALRTVLVLSSLEERKCLSPERRAQRCKEKNTEHVEALVKYNEAE